MRRTALFALALLGACGQPVSREPTARGVDVPQSRELAGRRVVEKTEGAWLVRKTVDPAGTNSDAPGSDARSARAMATGGIAPAEAAALPPGHREPTDPTPPPPTAPPAAAVALPEAGPAAGPLAGGEPALGSPVEAPGGVMPPTTPPQGLKAGATDDNVDYAKFLEFLGSWSDRPEIAATWDALDVRERRWLKVVNAKGEPVPAARLSLVDETKDVEAWAATTYGDGRAPFFPSVAGGGTFGSPVPAAPKGGWLVQARKGDARATAKWDGASPELVVTLDVAKPVDDPVRLDVLFLLDTTGSMGDEIDRVKATLLSVTQKIRAIEREFDLRYGAVLYKDVGDEYVTMAHPFTKDVQAFDEALRIVTAGGGGDGPESVNQGLAEAVGRMDWRDGAAKVVFLIADAPPHMDYEGDVRYGTSLKAALGKGIRIHAVAASGIDEFGSLVFRQIAQFTRGKFVFIEYGSPAASAESHGVTGEVKSNNLDDILYEQIGEELARWGRPS